MRQRADRTKRQPFGVMRQKLSVDQGTIESLKKRGMKPRWFNDDGSRVMDAINGGYEFVENHKDGIKLGTQETPAEDRRIKVLVGKSKNGAPVYAYLMAIKLEFYEEDQAGKEKTNKLVDDAIRGGSPRGLSPHGVPEQLGGSSVKEVQYSP